MRLDNNRIKKHPGGPRFSWRIAVQGLVIHVVSAHHGQYVGPAHYHSEQRIEAEGESEEEP